VNNALSATIRAGDFNRDGTLDLVAVDFQYSKLFLFTGDGRGAFEPAGTLVADDEPNAVVVADLNGDSKADLVVSDYGTDDVSVLLGNGDGTFAESHNYSVVEGPGSVVVADFNADGHLDVAVGNSGAAAVSILFGDGHGKLSMGPQLATESGVQSLAVVDVNADGLPDLMIGMVLSAVGTGNGVLDVLLGRGDGTFKPWQRIPLGSFPISIGVATLNADEHPDIAVIDDLENTLTVLIWNDRYRCL